MLKKNTIIFLGLLFLLSLLITYLFVPDTLFIESNNSSFKSKNEFILIQSIFVFMLIVFNFISNFTFKMGLKSGLYKVQKITPLFIRKINATIYNFFYRSKINPEDLKEMYIYRLKNIKVTMVTIFIIFCFLLPFILVIDTDSKFLIILPISVISGLSLQAYLSRNYEKYFNKINIK